MAVMFYVVLSHLAHFDVAVFAVVSWNQSWQDGKKLSFHSKPIEHRLKLHQLRTNQNKALRHDSID